MGAARVLIVGMTVLTVVAGIIVVAGHSGGNPSPVYAITPTPTKDQRAWHFSVDTPDQPPAGSTWQVTASAFESKPDVFPADAISNVTYRLWTREPQFPGEVALEVVSAGDVAADDMLDGADWELRGPLPGQGAFFVEVTYQVIQCDGCVPRTGHRALGMRVVNVVALRGDVNCNAASNSIDAALILQFAANLVDELACYGGADVNGDSSIDAVDATLILQYVAGLKDALPS